MTNDDHKAKQPRVWKCACEEPYVFYAKEVVPREDYDALASQLAEETERVSTKESLLRITEEQLAEANTELRSRSAALRQTTHDWFECREHFSKLQERVTWLERIKRLTKCGDYLNAEIEILGYEGNCEHEE